MAVSVLAPLLAVIGYVAAANALIWPTVASLGLLGLIVLLQRFATDIYLVATRSGEEGREALLPVLIGFLLTILAVPLFALIWGARVTDLYGGLDPVQRGYHDRRDTRCRRRCW